MQQSIFKLQSYVHHLTGTMASILFTYIYCLEILYYVANISGYM